MWRKNANYGIVVDLVQEVYAFCNDARVALFSLIKKLIKFPDRFSKFEELGDIICLSSGSLRVKALTKTAHEFAD